jgi:hypothetical protein
MPRLFAPQHFAPSNSASSCLHVLYTELHHRRPLFAVTPTREALGEAPHHPPHFPPSRGELPRPSTATRAHSGKSATRLGRRSTVDR